MDTYETLFGGVYHNWKYDSHTWFIVHSGGTQYSYLLEGSEKALLIDTGWGYGNIRAYVEALTNKPIEVICTHHHLDHIGGNAWWPECYLQKDYEAGLREHLPQTAEQDKKPYPNFRVHPVEHGDFLELGGRTIEILGIPAHADTSIALLDRNTRLLFAGDELECKQVLMFEGILSQCQFIRRVDAHRRNMLYLKSRGSDYDFLCPAHNGAPLSKEILDDFIALDEELLAGTQTDLTSLIHSGFEAENADGHLKRAQHGYAAFLYTNKDYTQERLEWEEEQ